MERDFLGPDIDIGFRISKFALRKRLVVSAHLAWLLFHERAACPEIEDQLRIVSLEILKGVWGGRHYSIIWFEKDWTQINDSFLYDEHLSSETVRRIKDGEVVKNGSLNLIEKVFSDLGKQSELDALVSALNEARPPQGDDLVQIEIPREKYSEVHCVAVCFSPEGKALAARRPGSKKRFPSAFEFGCGQLRLGDSFSDCLRRAYTDDFGAKLKVVDNPHPIGTFIIEDQEEHRKIPGIIFVAEIENPEQVVSHEKHSEMRGSIQQTLGPVPARNMSPISRPRSRPHFPHGKTAKSGPDLLRVTDVGGKRRLLTLNNA